MADILLIIGIILICLYGLKTVINHTKGEGAGCCNTSDKPFEIKKKHHGKVTNTMTFEVEGMHCEHCRIRVQNELNGIEGVVAHVNLKKKQAIVECEKEIDQKIILKSVEKCGYEAHILSD